MKKLLCVLSLGVVLVAVSCNRSEKTEEVKTQQEETRGESMDMDSMDTMEREEAMEYEEDENLGRPVDEVEVEEVERRIED